MEFKLNVKLTKNELFRFMFYHMYMNSTGIIYTVVAVLALAGGIFYLVTGNKTGIFLIAITLIYFVVMPGMLYAKAVRQSQNEVFQTATDYRLTKEALFASQDGSEESRVPWSQVRKTAYFGGIYIVYLSAVRASLLPLETFGKDKKEVDAFFTSVMSKNKLKGIH